MLSGIGEKDYLSTLGIDVLVDVPDVGQNLQVCIPYSLRHGLTWNHVGSPPYHYFMDC